MALENRHDIVLYFDVESGNPNGDPDAGNMPRQDQETGTGLVTDVCIKRKIRNYVDLVKAGATGYRIYVQEKSVLNDRHAEAYTALGIQPQKKDAGKDGADKDAKAEKKPLLKEEEAAALTAWMCENFYDIRTFGAVMSTGVNCGQVRGPVQFAFARSVDPIMPIEVSLTRMAVTNAKDAASERTMGRKFIVPYGLYRMEGFVSAPLAEKSGFSEDDLRLLLEALAGMFEDDRSASRGKMNMRGLYVFRHNKRLGNAPAQTLFDLVRHRRVSEGPARSFGDYEISVDKDALALIPGVRLFRSAEDIRPLS